MSFCPPNGRDPNPRPMQRGADGDSAFEVWRENQPIGADISLEAYLASMQGTPGKDGTGITDITITTTAFTE